MEFVFAYAAGLLTLINPCVLPVLPIVLASSLNTSRYGPLALAAGLSVSFVTFGVLVTAFGAAVGLTQELLAQIGAAIMVAFGGVLLMPRLAQGFQLATAGVAAGAGSRLNTVETSGLKGQFAGGALLGLVWSPCIGPTLGGAIALASQGENLAYVTLIMTAFALGVSTLIIGLGLGAREAIRSRSQALRGLAERSRLILGATFVVVGVALFFKLHHHIEALAIDMLPIWLLQLSVSL